MLIYRMSQSKYVILLLCSLLEKNKSTFFAIFRFNAFLKS